MHVQSLSRKFRVQCGQLQQKMLHVRITLLGLQVHIRL